MVNTTKSLNITERSPPKLRWFAPTDATVGSAYIYRATSKYGTYSLIGSTGSDTIEYTDTNGRDTNWYSIGFYDGTTISPKSNKVTVQMFDYLSDVNDVKRVGGLVNELSDDELKEFITTVDLNIFQSFGRPVIKGKTYTTLETEQYEYDMTGDRIPIYRLDRVEIAGSQIPFDVGSFTVDLNSAFITLDPALVSLNEGQRIEFEFIPNNYSLLSQFQTALDIFLSTDILRGADVLAPKLDMLKERINILQTSASVPGVVRSTEQISGGRSGLFVQQDFNNIY